ncbi:unnamed protein product [Symbiodinium sp. CCMP2592]|nr:unnamed protein product [Symbiodinium sp. CCMP2592]
MPEIKRVLLYQVHALPPVDSKRCILQPLRDAPSGSKLLSSTSLLLNVGDFVSSRKFDGSGALGPQSAGSSFDVGSSGKSGVPGDKGAHLTSSSSEVSSCESVHGSDSDAPRVRPEEVMNVLVLQSATRELSKCALVRTPRLMSSLMGVAGEERALKETLDPQVAKVLQGKRLKLLERIASSLGWADMGVCTELRNGFDLVGHHEHTGVFAHEPRPPNVSESGFINATQFLQLALLGKIRASASDANARELWDKTLDDVADGILEGPLSAEVLSARHGPCWLPTRRFGVEQTGRKLRPVDDFTENKVNLAFGSMDKLDLNVLDELICICRIWVRALNGPPEFSLTLSTGAVLSGRVHDG